MYKICDNKNMLKYVITIKNFLIVICEKKRVLNATGVSGSCDSPPCSKSREEPCWGTRKICFLLLKRP